jgi:DNA-nicking Smr family endonuclease
MKKSKPPEQAPADFKNNPFKSLKGFSPKTAPAEIKSTPAPLRDSKTGLQEDDASLFLSAVDGARRINHAPEPADIATGEQAAEKAGAHAPEDQQLFLQAMRKIGTSFREEATEPETGDSARRSQTSRMRQLKRGTIHISGELDLHGFLKDEALLRLGQFISSAFSRGQTAVLVITGKGINSPEGPVLQGAVAEWLRKQGKGMVAEFSPAPRESGGSGAFVVFLKRKN